MSKRLKALLLAAILVMTLAIAACGKSTPSDSSAGNSSAPTSAPTSGTNANTSTNANANFNPTGLPIVKNPVTLKVLTQYDNNNYKGKNYNDLKLVQQWSKDTNVNIEWMTYDAAAWNEKKNMLLASGDKLPDVILWQITDFDTLTYAAQGYWKPLDELIDKYTVNLKNAFAKYPDVRKSVVSPDGKIYTLPRFKGQLDMVYPNRMYINQSWLDKLGLKMPETIDDFYNVLKAFKTKDPNGNGKQDEIPYAMLYNNTSFAWTNPINRYTPYAFFGSFGRYDSPSHMVLEDGKPVFTADKEEYKNAVIWLRKAMEEGLIDPEAFTMDQNALKAKNTSGEYVYGVWNGWTVEETTKNTPEDIKTYKTMPPLTNTKGKKIWPKFGFNMFVRGYFQITKDCAAPEVAIRWIDYFCDPYFSIQNDWGIEGLGTKINRTDGTWEIIGSGHANVRAAEGLPWVAPTFVPPDIYAKGKYGDPIKKFENEGCQVYEPYATDLLPRMYFTLQETQEMGTLGTDINNYISKRTAEWITKGGIDKEWDEYISTLKKMGLDRYVKIFSDAYTRYNK